MTQWVETQIEIRTVDWRGNPIHLKGVRAIKDVKTGNIRVFPFDVARAEVEVIAEKFGIAPRDVGLLLMILAKPGSFREGEVLFKYHLQKLLFYLWKELHNYGYGESLPRDEFIAAKNGPVPSHLEEDLERLASKGWVKTRYEHWNGYKSKRIILTGKGLGIAKELWGALPEPYKKVALKVKERIYPLDPETVRDLVHQEYPEYRDTYVENDVE